MNKSKIMKILKFYQMNKQNKIKLWRVIQMN